MFHSPSCPSFLRSAFLLSPQGASLAAAAASPSQLERLVPVDDIFAATLEHGPEGTRLGLALRWVNILAPASRSLAGLGPEGSSLVLDLAFKGIASRRHGREPMYRALAKNERFSRFRSRAAAAGLPDPWTLYRTSLLAAIMARLAHLTDPPQTLDLLCAALRLEMKDLGAVSPSMAALAVSVPAARGAHGEAEEVFRCLERMGYASEELWAARLEALAMRVLPAAEAEGQGPAAVAVGSPGSGSPVVPPRAHSPRKAPAGPPVDSRFAVS